MSKRIICFLAALALIVPVNLAASASKSPKLAKCDGKQRRPANPYGSILPTVDPVNGTSMPAGQGSDRKGVEVFPETAPPTTTPARSDGKSQTQVPPISSITLPISNQSC